MPDDFLTASARVHPGKPDQAQRSIGTRTSGGVVSLESLALQVLLPSFKGTTVSKPVLRLLDQGLGGLCLFAGNTADGPDAVAAYTARVRSVAPQSVIAVDEEGGDITRLHVPDGSPVLGHLALGMVDDLALTEEVGRTVGLELAELGISLALAPVADVNSNANNPVIGTRSFGATAQGVAAHVTAWTRGLQSVGVAACAKHFPGHGDTSEDSHLALPVLDVELVALGKRELVPFLAAVEIGVAAVMTSHVLVPALDLDMPATMSPPILSLLRNQIGFRGVIVTDALDMAGASASRGIPAAAVLSVAAGADLLCLGPNSSVEGVRQIQAALVEAVRSGQLAEERLSEASAAVSGLSVAQTTPEPILDQDVVAASAARSVTVTGHLPDLQKASLVRVDSTGNQAVGGAPWGLPAEFVIAPGSTDLPDSPLILQVRDAHRQPEVLATLAAAPPGSVVVEWGWPELRADGLPTIRAHGWSQPGARVVSHILQKAGRKL